METIIEWKNFKNAHNSAVECAWISYMRNIKEKSTK